MPDKLKPTTDNSPPLKKYLQSVTRILLDYGEFTWPNAFKFTRADGKQIDTFADQAVLDGRLTRGHQKARSWIGCLAVQRMVRSLLEHFLSKGTISWDYAKLYIDKHTAEFQNLRAKFTIVVAKGHKGQYEDNFDQYMSPLPDENAYVCPIVWLMAHALRNGLVVGSTLQEVLDHTFARPDRRVQWTQPFYPVLCVRGNSATLKLDQPASNSTFRYVVHEMGVVSGFLGRAHPHALRYGAAREIAHLPHTGQTHGIVTPREQ